MASAINQILPQPIASMSGPISESSRILGIDVARGVALLGIFFVNAAMFGKPIIDALSDRVPSDEGLLSSLVYWFTTIFCTGKFFPLFSILFGIGLAMMHRSAISAGRKFGWTYFRRLALLALFGISHILFLWMGDILLIYAGIGLWMIWLGRYSPKTLLIIGGIVYATGILLALGFVLVMAQLEAGATPDTIALAMPEGDTRLEQLGKVLRDPAPGQVYDLRIRELEIGIMTEGPYTATMVMRIFNYSFMLVFIVLVLFWIVFPCFCVGAALLKLGFLHGELIPWRNRFIALGLFVGLPLNVMSAFAMQHPNNLGWGLVALLGLNVGGPLMSLMYLSFILKWVDSGRAAFAARAFAGAGRMALSSYLLESFLMSAVMLHWGMARFNKTTWIERLGWVLLIYLAIVIFAHFWMRWFKFGPLEWLWRSLTYWRWQPIRRDSITVEARS